MNIIIILIINFLFLSKNPVLSDDRVQVMESDLSRIEKNLADKKTLISDNLYNDLRTLFIYARDKIGWTQRKIARQFGLSENMLSEFINHERNFFLVLDSVTHFYYKHSEFSILNLSGESCAEQFLEIEKNLRDDMSIQICSYEDVRSLLIYAREKRGWTQRKISKQFGIPESTLSQFLNRERASHSVFSSLSDYYKKKPEFSLVTQPAKEEEVQVNLLERAIRSLFSFKLSSDEKIKEVDAETTSLIDKTSAEKKKN